MGTALHLVEHKLKLLWVVHVLVKLLDEGFFVFYELVVAFSDLNGDEFIVEKEVR